VSRSPRFPNLGERRLYAFGPASTWPTLAPFIAGRPEDRLITDAIALWNTVYLGRALDVLRRRGEAAPDALPSHIAPLGLQHINLSGDYLWGADAALGPDGFRTLRGTSTQPLAA
jgi:hypothetical protein